MLSLHWHPFSQSERKKNDFYLKVIHAWIWTSSHGLLSPSQAQSGVSYWFGKYQSTTMSFVLFFSRILQGSVLYLVFLSLTFKVLLPTFLHKYLYIVLLALKKTRLPIWSFKALKIHLVKSNSPTIELLKEIEGILLENLDIDCSVHFQDRKKYKCRK